MRSVMELANEDLSIPPVKYEYLDHTADVQLHSWGDNLEEAFEQCAIAMYGYMTDLNRVQITDIHKFEVEGDDLESLLFQFLNELLFIFCAESFLVAKKVKINEFDRENFKIKGTIYGEEFDITKHSQESEVKAITYSAMQILDRPEFERSEIFVIVDI
ncbi:hypothetical protein M0802_005107 [Mischocyttarus mexicanus]|nr:hypothetical protein M0802_005107 [Mischocyttarus mexicanus]